jgi:hypothetical protein
LLKKQFLAKGSGQPVAFPEQAEPIENAQTNAQMRRSPQSRCRILDKALFFARLIHRPYVGLTPRQPSWMDVASGGASFTVKTCV